MISRLGKSLVLGTAFVMLTVPALAQARPDTRQLTCEQAKAMLDERGNVVFTTGSRTYERLVADFRHCQRNEVLRRVWVITKDKRNCQLGHRCVPRTFSNQ